MTKPNCGLPSLTIESVCAHCGKRFERPSADGWVYRGRSKKGAVLKSVIYCSYGCMRAAEKEKEHRRK